MKGPWKFNKENVEAVVTKTSAGNYAFGFTGTDKLFYPRYVGRSDDDLKTRLLSWIGKTKRPEFKMSYAATIKEAFEKECENYHDFESILEDNAAHPARPEGKSWPCPSCKAFG